MTKRDGKQGSDSVRSPAEMMFAERFGDLIDRIQNKNPSNTLVVIARRLDALGVGKGISDSSLSGCRHGRRRPTEKVLDAVCDLAEVDQAERLELLGLLQNARAARKNKTQPSAEPTSETPAVQVRPQLPARGVQVAESSKARPRSFLRGGWGKRGLAVIAVCALLIAPEAASSPPPDGQDLLPATSGCSVGQRIPLVKIQGPVVHPPDVYLRACVEPLDGNRIRGVLLLEYVDGESYEAKVDWRVELRSCNRELLESDDASQERFKNESPFKRDTDPLGWNGGVRAKAKLTGFSVRDASGTQWESSNHVIMETPQCSMPPTLPGSSARPSVRP